MAAFGVGVETPIQRDFGFGASSKVNNELSRLHYSENNIFYPSGDQKFDELIKKNLYPSLKEDLTGFINSNAYKTMSDADRDQSIYAILKTDKKTAIAEAASENPEAFLAIKEKTKFSPHVTGAINAPAGATQ